MSHKPKPSANYISLKQYAKHIGVVYKTAYNRFHSGKIPGAYKSEADGHVYVPVEALYGKKVTEVVIYATTTSNNDPDLNTMEEEIRCMTKFCNTRGWTVVRVVREVCNEIVSGFRPKFNELLNDNNVRKIVINKKADICFYGFEYIKTLMAAQDRAIVVMDKSNEVSDYKTLLREVVNTIYAMCKVAAGEKPVSKLQVKKMISKLLLDF